MRILLGLFIISAVLGCSDFDKFYREKRENTLAPRGGSIIIARVGAKEITREELIKSLDRLPMKQRILYLSSPERMRDYLESYINQIVLHEEALRTGIGARKSVKENLENYERRLLIQTLSREITNREFSEEEIESYHAEHPDEFTEVKISQIFIRIEPEKGVGKDDARNRAEQIAKRVKAGEKFESLVAEFSDDLTSKRKGGSLGYVAKGRLPVQVESEIFELEEGEVSNPIETENGFYIIKIEGPSKILPLDRVRGRIRLELRRKAFSQYVEGLRERMKVEIFDDNLKKGAS